MARPLEMKVGFTDETLEKIAELKTEVQLREDIELLMCVVAYQYGGGGPTTLPDVDVAREVLRNVERAHEDDEVRDIPDSDGAL